MTLSGNEAGGWVISIDWATFGPALAMLGGALLALCADLLTTKRSFVLSWLPMLAGAVGAVVADLVLHGLPFGFNAIIAASTVIVVLASVVLHDDETVPPGEFQFLIGSAASGALVIVAASDLVTLLIGLELLTLPSIALVALRRDRRAMGTAWTFFLTSVVATALALMGIGILYGVAGSLLYGPMTVALDHAPAAAVAVGIVLTMVGFLFKIGAVPFHAWVPDAYRGASPVVAAFLSSVSKAASLGALLLLLYTGLNGRAMTVWLPVVMIVAVVSMTMGNLGALRQRDGVGVLAWSSIAQVGFLLAPATTGDFLALDAVTQYLAVYVVANLVGFLALAVAVKVRGSTSYDSLAGLGRTNPWVGVPLAFAVLTLAGFPPAVIGLVTKYIVFVPVIDHGSLWLAVVMAVNVMLGLAYYLKFVAVLFAPPDETVADQKYTAGTRVAVAVVVVGAIALVALSLWPEPLLDHVGNLVAFGR